MSRILCLVKVKVIVIQLCPTLWDPWIIVASSSVHGIIWERIMEWVSQSVQSLSHVRLFVTPWTAECQASLAITNAQSLLKLMSISSVTPSNHLILCHPLLLLPSIFPSIRVFSNESVIHTRCPKYWSFSFNISSSKEHSGLISFRMDWLDLLAVQETLKSLLQHHSSKASVLQHSAFFIVQLSHPYLTTGKTIALTRWTFVGKVMSLLSNMLSRLVIAFLPRNKHLFISWLQSPSAVILEPPQNKVSHCFHCFPIYLPWSDGVGSHSLFQGNFLTQGSNLIYCTACRFFTFWATQELYINTPSLFPLNLDTVLEHGNLPIDLW